MSFPAKYPGRCAYGDQIRPGDEVMYDDDQIAHTECVMELVREQIDDDRERRERTCPTCHLIKPCEHDDLAMTPDQAVHDILLEQFVKKVRGA